MKRIQITAQEPGKPQDVWYATAPPHSGSDAQLVERLNRIAKKRGVLATYAIATEGQYQQYKAETRAIINQ
jgi:hypothetical protein